VSSVPKIVSSTQAKANLGTLLKWIGQNDDEVIVALYNKPAAVLMTYAEYEEIVKLRKQEQQRQALTELQATRAVAGSRNLDTTVEEAYQLAGFLADTMRDLAHQSSLRIESAG